MIKMKKILLAASAVMLMSMTVLTSCTDKYDNPTPQQETNPDDLKPYTVKQLPVTCNGQAAGTVAIRFYEDTPSVPYISVSDFQRLMLPGSTVNVTKTGTGTYKLSNQGGTATVNTVDETFAFDDFMAFTNLMGTVQQGMDNAYLDGAPYVRYSHQTVTGGSPAITFNYAKYGINLRGDETNVYFPFTTLADVYADLHYHNAACNGEKVAVADVDDDEMGIEAFDPDFTTRKLMEKGKRPADLATYAYHELCFLIDHFYGMPGRSPYETSIHQIGIDKTLEASEDGKIIKALLLSEDMTDFAGGMELLQLYLDDGGHTHTWNESVSMLFTLDSPIAQRYPELAQRYTNEYMKDRILKGLRYNMLSDNRSKIYGNQLTYHKKGNTAICHFDGFHPTDMEAWRNFYNGTGPLPTMENTPNDALVKFLDALKKANDDPEVKNFVVDLTLNTGGSLDIVMAMTSLMYGESMTRCENTLLGQQVVWYYDVDRNFDGKFDEKDKDVHYDLNFCILTSDFSFSCGNLLPSLCKDAGLLVAGQKSGGGACAVNIYRNADGFRFQMSACRGRLVDKQWQNIDAGVVPNVLIETGPELSSQSGVISQPSLNAFYDLDNLSQIISTFYNNPTMFDKY